MSATTSIEWTDRTWNPLRGCSRVSEGCRHCYAERVAWRFGAKPGAPYHGLVQMTSQGPKWTGRVQLVLEALEEPLHWREPALIFVNSMSDLFHEEVPDAFIDAVVAVMWLAVRHTYQVLTKRPARARRYFEELAADPDFDARMSRAVDQIPAASPRRPHLCDKITENKVPGWPAPPTMWLGTSVEDQATADERIPELLLTPAAMHWISAEPLLASIELRDYWLRASPSAAFAAGKVTADMPTWTRIGAYALDWVVAGGESGQGARPAHPEWCRSLRDQCAAAGVPFLFKQWGHWLPAHQQFTADLKHNSVEPHRVRWLYPDGSTKPIGEGHPPASEMVISLSKHAAGRLLDGVLHDEFPTSRRETT